MCDPVSLAIGLTVASGGMQAYSQYKEGAAQKKYYNYLADRSVQEGQVALDQGDRQVTAIQDTAKIQGKQFKEQTAKFNSSQMAILAANGIDLGSVTAGDIALDSFNRQRVDESLLRYNADIQSYDVSEGARYENWSKGLLADQYRIAGKNAKKAGQQKAFMTLLSTAASTAFSFATLGGGGTGGLTGWLKGYGKGTPQGAVDMGTWTALPKGY